MQNRHQIGMGEPIKEEVDKIKIFWQNFKKIAKTKRFIFFFSLLIFLLILIGVISVLSQFPKKPAPPKILPTPTLISFPTPTPPIFSPPLTSTAQSLSKQLETLNYNDPDLSFPNLDWKISLKD